MRVLVTGAAGFIGWKTTELLLSEGHTVVGVDNFNDAYDVRLKEWRLVQLLPHHNFQFHRLDICDLECLKPLFEDGFDGVINLAARAGVRYSVENPWVYLDTNVTGTLNLLELCRQHGVRKFVLASTSSLYGKNNPVPFREDANTDGPLSPYAASKKAAEALCYTYHHLYGLDVTVLRYFTVYGPAGRPDMALFKFVEWISAGEPVVIYGDGQQSRDFTYVDDIARGTVAALRPLGYEVINLGSDRPVVLLDALRRIEELMGRRAEIRWEEPHAADMRATWADIRKARSLLSWQPQTVLEDGLNALVEWYASKWSTACRNRRVSA
jgi:nucleoside-diphosphate-sugar epimerase